jgi:hypothetical protein
MSKNIKIDVKEVTQADGSEIVVFETGEKTRICADGKILDENPLVANMIADLLVTTAIYNDDVFLVDDDQPDTEVEENDNGQSNDQTT